MTDVRPIAFKWRFAVSGLFALALTGMASAAEFSPALKVQLQNAQSSDLVSVIVILPASVDIRALDLQLHNQHATLAQRHQQIITALQYNAGATQPGFRTELDAAKSAGNLTGYTAYWIENLFVLQATRDFVESLRVRGDIIAVTENFHAELTESEFTAAEHRGHHALDDLTIATGVQACGAYRVSAELGITGAGTIVGLLDTGVDGNHPAYASRWRGLFAPWQECWRDALGGGTTFPTDTYGHGTAVLGTSVGRTISGADTFWCGCAPGALWIADNAINQGTGQEFNNDVIDAFQWFADPDGDPSTLDDVPDVISNAWGVNDGFYGYSDCFAFWNTAILNCEAAGPVVIWDAGVGGPAPSSVRAPANFSINAYQTFSVGAVDASDYPNAPYPIATSSGRGPTPCVPADPDNIKPEIVAPGMNVLNCNNHVSGTSFAAAHVAGVVALMREACPDCDYISIKDALMNTAIDSGYGPAGEDNTFGHGFIDAYTAVLAVMLQPVDDLTIHCFGSDIVLRWSAAPSATHYRIYSSLTSQEPWTLLDSTTATTFTHVSPSEPILHYDVRACAP